MNKPRSKKGTVSVFLKDGLLCLRWRTLGTETRHVIPLGVPETPSNRRKAEIMAYEIEEALEAGVSPDELKKQYKHQLKNRSLREQVDSQGLSVVDLFELFIQYKEESGVDERTIEKFRALYTRLNQFFGTKRADLTGLESAREFVEFLKQYQSVRTIKDRLATLSECWDWALGRTGTGVELNIWDLIKLRDEVKAKPKPFTKEEVKKILEGFQEDATSKFYYPYVYFGFNTGARPAEIAGLTWGAVANDFSYITIYETITRGNKKKPTKTGKIRTFPCNQQLQEFLRNLKPPKAKDTDLVFPAVEGGALGDGHFRQRHWTKILKAKGIPYRKPYMWRSTFVSHALQSGLAPAVVAEITGHDVRTLYEDYAGCVLSRPKVPDLYD